MVGVFQDLVIDEQQPEVEAEQSRVFSEIQIVRIYQLNEPICTYSDLSTVKWWRTKDTISPMARANTGKVNWSCNIMAMNRNSSDFNFSFSSIF